MKPAEQTSMFGEERLSISDSIRLTAESLNAYGPLFKHWAMAYSGGKDSSTVVTAVMHLLETGQVERPESLTVLYADTRMELTPLHHAAMTMLAELERRGVKTQVVLPEMDDRFFVYMFGRGVPPPSNTFRWCTPQIKVEPMERALRELRERTGEKILMLTGVRVGESAARDARIAVSCGKNGSECGQGWFQMRTADAIADTLAPCLHWRACHVWDWLMGDAAEMGFPTRLVGDAYGMTDDGTQDAAAARTGCVGCNLASRDLALERLIVRPKWAYLSPLMRLRPLYADLKKPQLRLRKQDERKADGTQVSNPGRLGPLTMDARKWGMSQIIDIQNTVNIGGQAQNAPQVSLIDPEEQSRIEELIEANTWPNKWHGDEITGDTLLQIEFTRKGGRQTTMALEMFG